MEGDPQLNNTKELTQPLENLDIMKLMKRRKEMKKPPAKKEIMLKIWFKLKHISVHNTCITEIIRPL